MSMEHYMKDNGHRKRVQITTEWTLAMPGKEREGKTYVGDVLCTEEIATAQRTCRLNGVLKTSQKRHVR